MKQRCVTSYCGENIFLAPDGLYYVDHNRNDDISSTNHTLWVIENGNLDYLKCPEELNWDTQTSCK